MIVSIEEEAERLYRLVENLLAIARAEIAETVNSEPIAVGVALEQAVKQFTNRHPSRPLELEHLYPISKAEVVALQRGCASLPD
jgi:K+-sensing histidine kinase KdpD